MAGRTGAVLPLTLLLLLAAVVAGAAPPQPGAAALPQQAGECRTMKDSELAIGKLCAAQWITTTTTRVVCNEFKPQCVQTVNETRLADPAASADDARAAVEAACKLLGYTRGGGGSIRITGDNPAAKQLCFNGKEWRQANWWTQLACCR